MTVAAEERTNTIPSAGEENCYKFRLFFLTRRFIKTVDTKYFLNKDNKLKRCNDDLNTIK